ncbi:MAG TPA: bifunctional alpha/beta hydrolase/OsmC family protein [Thermohalobaculum sp.]|nr:bifunctional alpha/beta hydrolase/OsmC family protein [Thermohalobaculum sp.]
MRSEKLEFTGHDGDTLAARLDLPEGKPKALALFAHCFTCGKDIAAARRIAGRLAALGIGVLRFDFTGLGHSDGEFANTHFSSNVADLVAAARALGERHMAPSLLIGHSLGGAAVLAAAEDIPSARAVVSIGAPAEPEHVLRALHGRIEEIREKGEAQVNLAGRSFTIRNRFLEDVEGARLKVKIAGLDRALLVLHAPLDEIVGIENASEIFLAARHPKSFVTLDDADHLLTRPADAEYAADVIAAWSRRYLGLKDEAPPKGAPEGVVRVSEADPEGFLQEVMAGPRHQLKADEPKAHGGSDLGPSPYQFVSAGLGACTSMTIRLYARRKGWPLAHVSVDITHDKVHAEDCADCEGKGAKIDQFRRVIRLEGELDDAQRARLAEIAGKCPVHRTLEGTVRVETELAE